MKTTQECWQALIDGEKLRHVSGPESGFVELNNGMLNDNKGDPVTYLFDFPQDWSIYTPPKWYDNIPEHGVPCWAWDNNKAVKKMAFIDRYDHHSEFPFRNNNNIGYRNAAPLTKQEIQQLMDNAPEGEGEW